MATSKEIQNEKQRLARLEKQLAKEKLKKRKQDTRRKIEFGGLVIKSEMAHYSKAVILGALLDAAASIKLDPINTKKLYQAKGEACFMKFGDTTHDIKNQ